MLKIIKKGLTIIEVVISLSVALTLIISLYLIVYWAMKASTINEYYIDVNNILIFISKEIQKYPYLYVQYNNNSNTFSYTQDAKAKLLGKLRLYNYKIKNKNDYDLELGRLTPLQDPLSRILEIEISLVWKIPPNKQNKTSVYLLVPVYNLLNRNPNIPLPNTSDISSTTIIIPTTTTTTVQITVTQITAIQTTTTSQGGGSGGGGGGGYIKPPQVM